ncbi:hypothetical protein [Qipengyuania flava]|uniref:hypothetical protein n=1 Tax=Qipengyuania flava TaxID=192812 RepID=UPI001CD3C3A6|nr:hypothetical protein [Qipengyuania flava]MCA0891262.1 hypothetical protein [Qipengyuania flava]
MHARLTFLAMTVWGATKEDADELVGAARTRLAGVHALEQVILLSLDLIPDCSERALWAYGRLDDQGGIGPFQLIVRDPRIIPVFLQVLESQV